MDINYDLHMIKPASASAFGMRLTLPMLPKCQQRIGRAVLLAGGLGCGLPGCRDCGFWSASRTLLRLRLQLWLVPVDAVSHACD